MTKENKKELKIQIPDKLLFFLKEKARYKVAYGGRGAGKSESIARCLLFLSLQGKIRILCTRELQKSITDSVHKLLSDLINELGLNHFFTVTQHTIRNAVGSEFIFKGLKSNINEIKSLQGINYVWIEEAEKVSENSWQVLIPTIRQEGSEIWVLFNPESANSATYRRFVAEKPDDCLTVKINYDDNPFFPDVLKREMEKDKKSDYELYKHIWEGEIRRISDAQVFKGKFEIRDDIVIPHISKIKYNRFFFGADFGFAKDPTTLIKCFILDEEEETNLYITEEAWGHGVDLNDMSQLFNSIDGCKDWIIKGDCSRPEVISYLAQPYDSQRDEKGFKIQSCTKWSGSVEDGIGFLRSFNKIYIDSSCKNIINEFSLYSYKIDAISGDILPVVIDNYNHGIDALRYALDDYIKNSISEDIIYDEQDNTNDFSNLDW